MPLYDFKCLKCDHVFEGFARYEERGKPCPKCEQVSIRLISLGTSAYREDAAWIESVLEVVDKTSKKPATRAFLESPTRANYKAWMKENGLRHMEEGEFTRPNVDRALEKHKRNMTTALLRQRRERNTINVRG